MRHFSLLVITALGFLAPSFGLLSQCVLPFPLSSGQFAILCRLPDPDSAINYLFQGDPNYVDLNLLSPFEGSLLQQYANLTANQICDYDCRCVHGAVPRGGRCGLKPGESDQSKQFCICDYDASPPREEISVFDRECAIGRGLRSLCPTLIGEILIGHHTCNEDCVCSHGYPPTDLSKCTMETLIGSDPLPFCKCGNGTNIPA